MGARRGTRCPALAVALAAFAGACAGGERAPARHEIEIRAFVFLPAAQAAQPGDTLVFVNRDAVPHTATAMDGSWDTGSIPANGTKAVAVPEAGAYRCDLHPTMTGRIDGAR